MERDLNNLRGDAQTAGLEFGFVLRGLLFLDDDGVYLEYEDTRPRAGVHAPVDEVQEQILRTLRGSGWVAEILECDDGENRIWVEVK